MGLKVMKKLMLLPLLASAMLAGCAVYPAEPAVGVNVGIGWHGDRYWDGQRYWERAEWERSHPPQYYRRDDNRRDDRGGYRDGDRGRDDRRGDDNRQY